MKQHKEKGIAHLGVILVAIIVIAAAAFGGWYVWERNKDESGVASQPSSPESSKSTESKTENHEQMSPKAKTFNCRDIFSVTYPESFQATITDAGQCLIANVSVEEMPAVGPLPPGQLGLFFNIQSTKAATSRVYLDGYIERSQEDYPLELKSQEEIKLNSGDTATLATIYGGHPTQHDFYLFIYIKNGTAIITSYPVDSSYKEAALNILKSIQ